MRRLSLLLALAATFALAGTATAEPGTKLLSFGTGEVTIEADGHVMLVNEAGEYSGVYLNSRSTSAKPIGSVDFSFDFTGLVTGGAPRFSIPIDTNEDGSIDGYAFLDAANCGYVTGDTGTVSTESETCAVFFGSESFANWDAFVAAHPTYRIAPGSIPFVIADQPGEYHVSNIDLR